MDNILLKLTDFKLCAFNPYVPLQNAGMENNNVINSIIPPIDAKVPGSVYSDLLKAGLIEDPYRDTDSLKCEWVAARWWVYTAYFDRPQSHKNLEIVFEGLDYKSHIYLNGEKLGEHENMFTPVSFNITENLKEKNNFLKVILESAPDEMGQTGYTSRTFTQKARFTYKWDFCVRMIGMGIYKPVYIRERGNVKINGYHIRALSPEKALLDIDISCLKKSTYTAQINISDKGGILLQHNFNFEDSLKRQIEINSDALKLWYPLGSGSQNLYNLKITIKENNEVSDIISAETGFKVLKLEKAAGSPEDSLPYRFNVNGKTIFLKGVNIVPLDMMYGNVDRARYENLVKQLAAMNVNFVRVWGGGLIESEDFYSLCDKYGIMVWQDLIQSSSGIDNFPSQDARFINMIGETACYASKTLRNHVSLVAFCGGNELMYPDYRPVGIDNENIKSLYEILLRNCPEIPFYPTTPSGLRFSADLKYGIDGNHDVHGPWTYSGIKDYYDYYNNMECLMHSEFGVDGITNINAIKKCLSKKHRIVCDFNENSVWRFRGEWWNTYKRDTSIFGRIRNLKTFSLLSQFIQAEGLRYAVDAGRRQSDVCGGEMIWQANEPYPNGSCTSLIDYYGEPKASYYAVKNSYAKIAGSFEYGKLVYEKNEKIPVTVFAVSDEPFNCKGRLNVYFNGKISKTMEYVFDLSENKAVIIDKIMLEPDGNCSNIKLEIIISSTGNVYVNRAMLLIKGINGYCDKKAAVNFCKILKTADVPKLQRTAIRRKL